jgi:hypothetical protein
MRGGRERRGVRFSAGDGSTAVTTPHWVKVGERYSFSFSHVPHSVSDRRPACMRERLAARHRVEPSVRASRTRTLRRFALRAFPKLPSEMAESVAQAAGPRRRRARAAPRLHDRPPRSLRRSGVRRRAAPRTVLPRFRWNHAWAEFTNERRGSRAPKSEAPSGNAPWVVPAARAEPRRVRFGAEHTGRPPTCRAPPSEQWPRALRTRSARRRRAGTGSISRACAPFELSLPFPQCFEQAGNEVRPGSTVRAAPAAGMPRVGAAPKRPLRAEPARRAR